MSGTGVTGYVRTAGRAALLALALLVVCATPIIARAKAAAAARSGASSRPTTSAPAPATSVANSGQLILSQQHVSQGTTSLGVAIAAFRDGERVTVTWARPDGSGAATLGTLTAQPPAGGGATTVALSGDAAPATYTVTATGDRGSAARAFVTVDPPGATPAPTAVAYSPRVLVPPDFTHGISGTSGGAPAGNGDQFPVTVQGYPPHTRLTVTMRFLARGGQPARAMGQVGPTGADGAGGGHVTLPNDLAPGPYDVEVTSDASSTQAVPVVRAGATTMIHAAASDNLPAPSRDAFAGLWQNATEGGLTFVNRTVQAGRSGLVAGIAAVALHVEDWTTDRYAGIWSLAEPFLIWSGGVLTFAVAVRTFLVVRRARRLHDAETLMWVAVELAAVISVVGSLKTLESSLWTWTGAESAWFVRGGLGAFGQTLDRWTSITPHDIATGLQWGLAMFMALALEAVLSVQLVVLGLTRLGGDGFLVFLWLSGALCAATYALERTRGLALTWLRTIVAISLWPVLWGWLFGGEGTIVDTFTAGQPASFGDAFLKVAIGVAMLLGFNAVPEVLRIATRHVLPGPGSEVDGTRTPFHRAGQALRERVPLLGRL